MAAKKRAQAKRKQQRMPVTAWLKPLLAVLTVTGSAAGLALLVQWSKDPQQWPVRSVQLQGEFRHLQRDSVQNVVAPLTRDGFFALNVARIQEQLGRLPWVDRVSVRRVWPDRLQIQLHEQRPVARWGERGFLNARGETFEPAHDTELPRLPGLQGPDGYQHRVLAMYQRMRELLQPLQLDVTSLQLDARRTWQMRLSNGLDIAVGRNDPVERIVRFVSVYPAILAAGNGQVVSVDLRYSNGFAVHWRREQQETKSTG